MLKVFSILNRLSKSSPKIAFYKSLGKALMLMDCQPRSQSKIFKTSLMLDPKNSDTHANIGALFWEKGCMESAQKKCLTALSLKFE